MSAQSHLIQLWKGNISPAEVKDILTDICVSLVPMTTTVTASPPSRSCPDSSYSAAEHNESILMKGSPNKHMTAS